MSPDIDLSLSGEAFDAVRHDFDLLLKRTVETMNQKQTSTATITLKLNIELDQIALEDGKKVTKPTFKYDVSTVTQLKDRTSGTVDGDYVMLNNGEAWVIRACEDGQMTLFDDEYEYPMDEEEMKALGDGAPEVSDYHWLLGWCKDGPRELQVVIQGAANCLMTVPDGNGSQQIILSSTALKSSQLYCPADELRRREGHRILMEQHTGAVGSSVRFLDMTVDECFHEVPDDEEAEVVDVDSGDEEAEDPSWLWEYLLGRVRNMNLGRSCSSDDFQVNRRDDALRVVADLSGDVFLSTAASLDSPMYVPEEVLQGRDGHRIRVSLGCNSGHDALVYWDLDRGGEFLYDVPAPADWNRGGFEDEEIPPYERPAEI